MRPKPKTKPKQKPKPKEQTMIKQNELKAALERINPQSWTESDFRKLADGRIVRFTNWNRKAAR